MAEYIPTRGTDAAVETHEEIRPPVMYRVLMHNDNYTTMPFVVEMLMQIFNKEFEDAFRIMLHVHRNGVGMCGVYAAEVAETKIAQVHRRAEDEGFPLKCTMEPA